MSESERKKEREREREREREGGRERERLGSEFRVEDSGVRKTQVQAAG